ncbi:hypothetical protein BDR06DRAFT_1006638 [Suillus hirtellus]|nr:hypothetical protein BDR06DRAFT_1006638 [Suillus hirtellus]
MSIRLFFDCVLSPSTHPSIHSTSGHEWPQTSSSRNGSRSQTGENGYGSRAGRNGCKPRVDSIGCGPYTHKSGCKYPIAKHTPAASVWWNMEEFSSTLEVIDEYIIVPESTLLLTFQAVQQFKNLPDLLAFPVLLSLGHPSQRLSKIYSRADMEIGHAIAFSRTFTNEAQKQSQSASSQARLSKLDCASLARSEPVG